MSQIEYLALATDRLGKIEDVALCNSYSLAKQKAANFAACAPSYALITVYECNQLAVMSGRIETESVRMTLRGALRPGQSETQ